MSRERLWDYGFMAAGLLIQTVTFLISLRLSAFDPHILAFSFVSGCLGVCSVCLTAQRNILTFVFGFLQVITYTWLCYTRRFYGEMAINAYYFVTMIYGVTVWKKHMQPAALGRRVQPRSLSLRAVLVITALTLAGSALTGWGLAAWTDDTQPWLDAFTTVPALVAQVLMILVYREHWFIWLAVDILSVILWLRAGDGCMTAQYAFWCANCVYGMYKWKKGTAISSSEQP